MTRGGWFRVWALVALIVGILSVGAWASDFITMQGERTVYTVECRQGEWKADVCSGTVAPGLRYRYRALRAHREVIFWTLGTSDRSGKFDDCDILDGRNWLCRPNVDVGRSITREMAQGEPVPGPLTRPFRAVSKWRWLMLDRGIAAPSAVAAPHSPASTASAAA